MDFTFSQYCRILSLPTRALSLVTQALVLLAVVAVPAVAQETSNTQFGTTDNSVGLEQPLQRKRLGFEIGLGVGASRPFIQAGVSEDNDVVTNRATNFHLRAGGIYRVSPWLHLTASTDWSLGRDLRPFGHKSGVLLLGVGGVLGNLDRTGSFYLAGSVGRGYIDISDEEFDSLGATFRSGARGEGMGYRISAGRTLTPDARVEFSYTRIDGDTPDDELNGRVDFHAGSLNIVLSGIN